MNTTIRPGEEGDFEHIIGLFREFAAFEKLPHKMTNTVERMRSEKQFFNCFVAELDGHIIGYATWFFCYYTWTGKSLYMDDLYVKSEYRGHGIGTQLVNSVINKARLENCHKLRWQVSDWNTPAIHFYKSLGAEIDTVERNCDLVLR